MLVQAERRTSSFDYAEAKPNIADLENEDAAIAQLVEHNLAKVRVASSSLVCRSYLFERMDVAQVAEW